MFFFHVKLLPFDFHLFSTLVAYCNHFKLLDSTSDLFTKLSQIVNLVVPYKDLL